MSISMLYHYTSLEGLIGILKSQSIRASNCEFLSDSREFHHALDFAKTYSGNIYMEDDYLAAFGWAMRRALDEMDRHDVYVTSFSEKSDLLSQWRGYCPQGAGVCIGFDKNVIQQYCSSRGYKLLKCLYDTEMQQDHISKLIHLCLQKFPKPSTSRSAYQNLDTKGQSIHELNYQSYISEGEGKPEADKILDEFCNSINECAPTMKNFGFHEETEWRIVARNPTDDIHHRSSNSHLVPYIQLPVIKHDANAIKKIIVGPNPSSTRCEASISSLLCSHNLEGVDIEISAIPFSSW